MSLNERVTQWTAVESSNLLFVGAVFTRATHPELIVHQWAAGHNACRELGVAVWTNVTPEAGKGSSEVDVRDETRTILVWVSFRLA